MRDDPTGAAPLDAADFALRMNSLGPFESGPVLAVGVSGGADSLALCLLAEDWARARGGRVEALIVDHALRSESAAEALQVAGWLAERGISHHILRWEGAKPSSGVQAAAREARYRLTRDWCSRHGVLYLLLGHHRDDQAETFLLRLGRGSGVDGLSAMAPVSALPDVLLLRPLLDVPHARLMATLRALEQPWVEDPSNASGAYRRVRLRRMAPALSAEGLDGACLAATAGRLARARRALERATCEAMVRAVAFDGSGFAWLRTDELAGMPEEVCLRLLARLCRTIGGEAYPPRLERLERLSEALRSPQRRRRTFAGCLLTPKKNGWLVCREPGRLAPSQPVQAGQRVLWDGRFDLFLTGRGGGRIDGLGHQGWLSIRDGLAEPMIPLEVIMTLPALFDHRGISAVPHLGYKRRTECDLTIGWVRFVPANPLTQV
ncbi:tRNA lysidine(34) synthetase TilS [Telmatospirillum siberiense]|uniref:tRNA lysidine(34) synthetase TilS n=1 Tax=Telmatospirillum siberiense TaxID=382514 RepID=UPI0011AF9FF6|nr:tRNA lysidine(34) synthetase TilS [Telmatospirillum siberiense]